MVKHDPSGYYPKNCKRASTFANQKKNYSLKSLSSKIFKTANKQA